MFQIQLIVHVAKMSVYRRCWREPGLKRYFVLREYDGRILEEFNRKAAAVRWATANQNA